MGRCRAPPFAQMKILFLADVFGPPAAARRGPAADLRRGARADLCIVNGENAADGSGLTAKLADKLLAAGADVLDREPRLAAPRPLTTSSSGARA